MITRLIVYVLMYTKPLYKYIDKKLSFNFICVQNFPVHKGRPFNLFITILQQIMQENSPLQMLTIDFLTTCPIIFGIHNFAGVKFKVHSYLLVIMRELLCELFSPHNHEKWVHNQLLNFSVYAKVDQTVNMNATA